MIFFVVVICSWQQAKNLMLIHKVYREIEKPAIPYILAKKNYYSQKFSLQIKSYLSQNTRCVIISPPMLAAATL